MEAPTVDHLVSQYHALETSPPTGGAVEVWYIKYMLYIALLAWTVLFMIIARPITMYDVDENTDKKQLRFGKVMTTCFVIYGTLIGVVVGIGYVQKRFVA